MLEAREENFMLYSVEGCREIQKQEDRKFVINEGSENIVEYAMENNLRTVPVPVSRLIEAKWMAC